jgi:hypothetical protein
MPLQQATSVFQPGTSDLYLLFGPAPTGREWHVEWISIFCNSFFPVFFTLASVPAAVAGGATPTFPAVTNADYVASTEWGNEDYAYFDPPLVIQQGYWLVGDWGLNTYAISDADPRSDPNDRPSGSWRIQYSDVPLDERYIVPELG